MRPLLILLAFLTSIGAVSATGLLFYNRARVTGPEPVFHYMPWHFHTFTEPCFTANATAYLRPQIITVLHEENGWALIPTSAGQSWVYINADKIYLERTLALHNEIGGEPLTDISPQVVEILERQGNWILIPTWLGNKWVYLDALPGAAVAELENFFRAFEGQNISIYYSNIRTGFTFTHNAERVYFAASVAKAPFALYIYLLAERGEAPLNSFFVYTAEDYWGGSGVIRYRYEFGHIFTLRQLLGLNLYESDNIATRILRRAFGYESYADFIEEQGGNRDFVGNVTFSLINAYEAGFFAGLIHDYIASGGRYSYEFRNNLFNNQYPFIISDYPVASKTGWSRNHGGAWHDMAIVYAPSPYILVILSDFYGNDDDRTVFEEISIFIQSFNEQWF